MEGVTAYHGFPYYWDKEKKKIQVSCISPTSYNSHEMTQMSVEWNCIVHRSMTHMSNTQDVKNNNTHNAQDHNISCNLTKTILQTKQSRWFSGGREVSNAWNQVSHTCALDRSANASSAINVINGAKMSYVMYTRTFNK